MLLFVKKKKNVDNKKMAFMKEESEDIRIAEVFSIKHEDTEEQTGWFLSQS